MTEHRALLTCGEHAVLVEVGGLDQVLAFTHAVRAAVAAQTSGLGDIVDIVPAATTVLVVVDEDIPIAPVRKALAALPVAENGEVSLTEETIEIPVRYDGPDLTEVAQHTGLSTQEIIAAHTGTDWRVALAASLPASPI